MPRLRVLIESEIVRGKGIDDRDPVRRVLQYHDVDGAFVAERDRWREEHPTVVLAHGEAVGISDARSQS